jgi:hypothetical protein
MARLSEQSKPMASHINTLDADMMSILDDKVLSPYEKWLRYSQTLNRYMQYRDSAVRKPVRLDIREDMAMPPVTGGEVGTQDFDHVINSIPVNFRSKARLLLDRLLADQNFSILPSGEVSLDATVIQQSNIVDLISDVVRKRKNFSPVGWQQFAAFLARANIPRDWIGNTERYLAQTTTTPRRPSVLAVRRSVAIKATPTLRRKLSQAEGGVSYHTPPSGDSRWTAYRSAVGNADE